MQIGEEGTWANSTDHKGVQYLFAMGTTAIALPAQTLTTLYSFDGTDGALPH